MNETTPARPRVLLVSRKWPPAIGGMETYAVELDASLATRFDVERWLLPGRKDGRPPGMAAYAVFVAKCMLRSLFAGRRHERVVYVDPVLFPVALVHALVAPSARRIVVMHGLDVIYGQRRGLLPALYRLYFGTLVRCQRVFSQVVTVSSSTAALARAAGLRAVTVVNPSLPDSALTRAQGTRDVSAMRSDFARTVLCFGRLVPRKGALWFAQHVLPRLPEDVGLIVAGPSTHADQPALLASLPRVRYVGAVDPETLASLVRAADVVAMPNIRTPESLDVEGFGLVAIEASSLGGRLLASRLQGLVDAVTDGVTGTLVEPGDAEAWAAAVLASFEAQRDEPIDHRNAIAAATRRIYSRTVQAGAFARLLLPSHGE